MQGSVRALFHVTSPPHPQLSALTGSDVGRPYLEGAVALGPVTTWFAYKDTEKHQLASVDCVQSCLP